MADIENPFPLRFPIAAYSLTYEKALTKCAAQGAPRGDTVYYPDGDKMENILFRDTMNSLVSVIYI